MIGSWNDSHGRVHSVYIPDSQVTKVVRYEQERAQEVAAMNQKHGLEQLAKAGLWGIVIVGVIALFAGLIAMLPKPVRTFVILAFLGMIVWMCVFPPKTQEAPAPKAQPVEQHFVLPPASDPVVDTAPRAELVNLPVRRAELVDPRPHHHQKSN